jgi:3-carboxy-cis,cis-muconate cycloisomerase
MMTDEALIQAMLLVEVRLARVQARLGIIPAAEADAVEAAAAREFAPAELMRAAERAGTVAIPLVKDLWERAPFAHWGATSQDISDTAVVVLLKGEREALAVDQKRLQAALRRLSDAHRNTVMLGRTLMQPAPPVTFGLKAAGWLAASVRGWDRVESRFSGALVVQFGGASGTLASLGDRGDAVGRALAEELGLAWPDAPWHTYRDRIAALLAACAIYTGSLAKMARDIALLMQSEVGELSEPASPGRGGSSTMPHKRNPTACALTLAAAQRMPGLLANYVSAMPQEHERGVGGWQSEWPTIAEAIQATALAAASMAETAEGLTVYPERMRANLDATMGTVFAERASLRLGAHVGRAAAHKILEEATRRCLAERRRLSDLLREMPEVTRHVPADAWNDLESPEAYLGAAETFRTRLISSLEVAEEEQRCAQRSGESAPVPTV